MLQRMLGREVTHRHLRRGARAPGRARARRARPRQPARRARATTASCAPATSTRSAPLGTRFLQLPLGEVEHVDAARVGEAAGMTDARRPAPTTAPPTSCGRSTIEPGFVAHRDRLGADHVGETRVICTASVRRACRAGWRAAAAAGSRPSTGCSPRRPATASSATSRKGRPDGRTVEIQRLIGRSLRGVVDFAALGERTIYLDCDVLQADGGTRCASITGAYVALALACARSSPSGELERSPLTGTVAAISCGHRRRRRRCSTSTTPRTPPPRSTPTSS